MRKLEEVLIVGILVTVILKTKHMYCSLSLKTEILSCYLSMWSLVPTCVKYQSVIGVTAITSVLFLNVAKIDPPLELNRYHFSLMKKRRSLNLMGSRRQGLLTGQKMPVGWGAGSEWNYCYCNPVSNFSSFLLFISLEELSLLFEWAAMQLLWTEVYILVVTDIKMYVCFCLFEVMMQHEM